MTKSEKLMQIVDKALLTQPLFIQALARPYLLQLNSSPNREQVAENIINMMKETLEELDSDG